MQLTQKRIEISEFDAKSKRYHHRTSHFLKIVRLRLCIRKRLRLGFDRVSTWSAGRPIENRSGWSGAAVLHRIFHTITIHQRESNMSLKFGIYLVEQRVISPEQFCGLVKIQQESMMTLASMAVRKNVLSIRQVSTILDLHNENPEKLFGDIALGLNLIDRAELNQLLHAQQATCPSVRQLLIECGLLTTRQTRVLFMHFEKNVARMAGEEARSRPAEETAPSTPTAESSATKSFAPRKPKFNSRPAATSQLHDS